MPRLARPLVLAVASVAALTAASAQSRYTNVVAFGDSYADNGNLFRIVGQQPPPVPYQTGRFSGGTNFVDTLQQIYGATQTNYAIGGAQTGSTNIVGPGIPGFAQEYNGSLAGNPRYSGLPAGTTFGPSDLVVVSIGGNDARGYEQTGGTVAGAAAAAAAAASRARTGLDVIVGRGARTIVVLGGDVGQLPEVAGNPAVAAVGTAYSRAFNGQVQTLLAGYANRGVTAIYTDLSSILTSIRANPGRFGFTNTTGACPVACVTDANLASQYVFYVDALHLTSAGFNVVGKYIAAQLAIPYRLRAQSDLVLSNAAAFNRTLEARTDLARGRPEDAPGKFALFGQFRQNGQHRATDVGGDHYSARNIGGTLGVEGGLMGATVGVAFDYTAPQLDQAGSTIHAHAYQIGGYGVYRRGGLFAEGYADYGWHTLHVRSDGVIGDERSNPKARSYGAGGRIGYLVPLSGGAFSVGPVGGVDYAHARVRGYTSSGDPALDATFGRQLAEQLTGDAGVELRGNFEDGAVSPYVRATLAHDFLRDGKLLRYSFAGSPEITNALFVPGDKKDTYGLLAAGFQAEIAPRVSVDLSGRISFDHDRGNAHAATGGVRLAF